MLTPKRHPYTGNLNRETTGDSKNVFLHCGDILGQQGPHLKGGLGYGVGFERLLEVLSAGWLVLLGCLLLGQGLAIE